MCEKIIAVDGECNKIMTMWKRFLYLNKMLVFVVLIAKHKKYNKTEYKYTSISLPYIFVRGHFRVNLPRNMKGICVNVALFSTVFVLFA